MKTVSIPKLFHVGTLNIEDRKIFNQEGKGLSASLTPHEWCKIGKGHIAGDFHLLTKESALFAVFCDQTISDAIHWGLELGFISRCDSFRYPYFDDESQTTFFDIFETMEDAKENVDESDWSKIEKSFYYKTNDLLREHFKPVIVPPTGAIPQLFCCYIEQNKPNIDGVWFDFKLDVHSYSAPTAIIFDSKLRDWSTTLIDPSYAPIVDDKSELIHYIQKP